MPATLYIDKPETFSFRHTICSHGWYDLAPFEMDRENFSLTYVFTAAGRKETDRRQDRRGIRKNTGGPGDEQVR